ncbi:MAG: DUF4965 domain-containing protein [Planctomycetes bacterium]|nr:DUF4965 domain-containing protein [Planctomycetota bacterium]
MQLITDVAATLGGRFNLIFHPRRRRLYQNAFGEFLEIPLQLTAGIKGADGRTWTLPFTRQGKAFPFVEQFDRLTQIRYRAVQPEIGIEFVLDLRAPFYPQNAQLSAAPFYYLDLKVRRLESFQRQWPDAPLERGHIVFTLEGDSVAFSPFDGGFLYAFTSAAPAGGEEPPFSVETLNWIDSADAEPFGESGLRKPFDLSRQSEATMSLIWSTWVKEPVLEVDGRRTHFKYNYLFDSREKMLGWARQEKASILERCDFLDGIVADWSLGAAAAGMSALALHSFLANTWWTQRDQKRDWFSVWEGNCYYHSTIDVEYNDALLYFALWPELLEMLLDEWSQFEIDSGQTPGKDAKSASFLCHDMGAGLITGHQVYPHHMPVEENANYLLLLAAWTAFTGKTDKAAGKIPLCRRLAEFILSTDTTGNGAPDQGTANTIDDGSPAVQYGGEQTYLAVKSQAALWALAELELKCDVKPPQSERWRAFASKGARTVEEQGWRQDHYALNLSKTTAGLKNPWSDEPLAEGPLQGRDAYSIYTANGLLYPFLANLKRPHWKLNRFADDIENATRRTMGAYGCRHSSASDRIVWLSQNMWRDYVAAYLGIDMLDNIERYWDYQLTMGSSWGGSLYYDTTEPTYLAFYPRGATVFGMALSSIGFGLNRIDGELTLRPLRSTMHMPLLPLADWKEMRVPWLTVKSREDVAIAFISERDLLADLTVTVIGAQLEPE